MNYIKEINSFYDWLEINSVSDSAITLWYALMHINNKSGWKGEFTVAISTLMGKTSLSKSSIIRARNLLKQLGRIDFKERKGNQSCIYTLFAFHTDTQNDTQSGTQSDTQSDTQADTINKLNKTKLNSNVLLKKEPKEREQEISDFEKLKIENEILLKKLEEEKRKKVPQKKEKEIPPKIDDVRNYCLERNNGINPDEFFNFYASKDWMIGKNKMRDWQAAIRTWENSRNKINSANGKSNNNNSSNTGYKPAQTDTERIIRELESDFANGNIPGKYQ